MTHLAVVVAITTCWAAFALTWVAGAIYNISRAPAARRRVPFGWAFLIGAVIIWLVVHVLPVVVWRSLYVNAPWVRVLGLVVLATSTAFTLWARFELGRMWSATPSVKQGHELRTDGPYRIVRHPIYTGLLGMLAGTMFLQGVGWAVVPLLVGVVIVAVRVRIEERLMVSEFPEDYPRYRQRVPQLVPGLRIPRRRAAA